MTQRRRKVQLAADRGRCRQELLKCTGSTAPQVDIPFTVFLERPRDGKSSAENILWVACLGYGYSVRVSVYTARIIAFLPQTRVVNNCLVGLVNGCGIMILTLRFLPESGAAWVESGPLWAGGLQGAPVPTQVSRLMR